MNPLADFTLAIQPMVHVRSMADSIAFFEALGAELVFGSRDGDWVLLQIGGGTMSLLGHKPSADSPWPVELQFTCATQLETIEEHLREVAPGIIERGTADEAFGKMLQLRTPDGLLVKVLQLDRELIG